MMTADRRQKKVHRAGMRAFSLIEILVSLAVFAIIMTTVGSVFFHLYRDWKKQKDYMNVLQDSYWAAEALSSEIRQATDIAVIADPPGWRVTTNYLPDKTWCILGTRPQFVWIWRERERAWPMKTPPTDTMGFCTADTAARWTTIGCRAGTGRGNTAMSCADLSPVITMRIMLRQIWPLSI
jgi:prepilin-type N-terminal cleavage/methylation domain-containing protein